MDLENSGEVLDVSEPPQQEESVMEKEVLSKLETPEEPTEPEKPPAADGETEQLPVNGHDAEVINLTETEELNVTETVTLSEERTEMEMEDSPPIEPSDMESEPVAVAPPEPDESSEKISDPEAENTQPQEQPEPENDPLPVQAPLADKLPEPEPEKPSESVPEAEQQEQMPPEPEAVQLMNTEPLIQEEKVSELVDTETQQQTPMDIEAEAAEPLKVVKEEKPAEIENLVENLKTLVVREEVEQISDLVAGASPEKPAETEKMVETVLVADVSPEKPAETEKMVETVVVADVSPEKSAETEKLVETVLATEVQTELVPNKSPEKPAETEKVAETVPLASVSPENPAEPVTLKEESVAENEIVKPAEEEKKEMEQEKSIVSDTLKGVEAAAGGEGDKSETKAVEAEKEEETVPASGSLSFALLEQEQTKDALRISRTLVVLRGLPGSGKSFLARAIADAYKDHCSVLCADEHGVKPESPEASADGYKALDDAVVACCGAAASSVLVVVDDTNHTQDRLAHLGEIAEQHHLVAVFLEPRTEWSRDPAQLTKKTRRGLEAAQLEAMKGPLSEMSIPLYFGWFLLSSVQEKVRCTSMDFLKTLDTLETFKKHLPDFTGKAEKEVDLEQYFQAKGALHCTTKFCNYGKAEGAKEYADNQAVKDLYGTVSELSLSALFVTPRTVGARVSLTEEQLMLWPADAEKEADVPAAASLPRGSRAHVTLGCAEGVEPVQTGLDLLEILALQQEGQQGELVEEMELGSLTYYGSGRWLLSLREPICAPACFSSYYGRKESEPAKKEPERRRNKKCTIL
ncbi:fibrous sheath CABYR-binding protein [Cheilinus undulatus]|uniref:fibrous sheath CABYR-binding protein n=1 Tax=Cheilinus undulatus TaxID=241271 RepID=UPI001BD2064B|nr:fibrous sheath CABYR-binding protein [Cheilinus undulatus]